MRSDVRKRPTGLVHFVEIYRGKEIKIILLPAIQNGITHEFNMLQFRREHH
jgi:hypothetical protein